MPKPKQFLRDNKKKSKHSPSVPATADEFLVASVEYEEAGEKWRGGDAAKSMRFFMRALESYEAGLQKFPSSFDLAYNTARLQFDITQHPKLKPELPGTPMQLLQAAYKSSQVALQIRPKDAAALFNHGQILTSIFDAISESSSATPALDLMRYLREALQCFQSCLEIQEASFNATPRAHEDMTEPDVEEGGVSLGGNSVSAMETSTATTTSEWATVESTITTDDLVDTLLAMFETLTSMCPLLHLSGSSTSELVLTFPLSYLSIKLRQLLASTDRATEAGIILSTYGCAFANAEFLEGKLSWNQYFEFINSACNLSTAFEGLCNLGEILMTYNSALRTAFENDPGLADAGKSRWDALTKASETWAAASKLPGAENLDRIHSERGDCELLRYQLAVDGLHKISDVNMAQLLKNAAKLYGAAKNIAEQKTDREDANTASVKCALALALQGDPTAFNQSGSLGAETGNILIGCLGDGLVTKAQLDAMNLQFGGGT